MTTLHLLVNTEDPCKPKRKEKPRLSSYLPQIESSAERAVGRALKHFCHFNAGFRALWRWNGKKEDWLSFSWKRSRAPSAWRCRPKGAFCCCLLVSNRVFDDFGSNELLMILLMCQNHQWVYYEDSWKLFQVCFSSRVPGFGENPSITKTTRKSWNNTSFSYLTRELVTESKADGRPTQLPAHFRANEKWN